MGAQNNFILLLRFRTIDKGIEGKYLGSLNHALPISIEECSVRVVELIILGLRHRKGLVMKQIDMLLNAKF